MQPYSVVWARHTQGRRRRRCRWRDQLQVEMRKRSAGNDISTAGCEWLGHGFGNHLLILSLEVPFGTLVPQG